MDDNQPSTQPMRSIPAMVDFEYELRRKQLNRIVLKKLRNKVIFWSAVAAGVIIANKMAQEDKDDK